LNIQLFTLSEITGLRGSRGRFEVDVLRHPRYVDPEKCIACGTCEEKCPKKADSEYNENLSKRKAIYVPYSQAVPLKYLIDRQTCIYFQKGKCRACEKFCPTGAVNFDDTEEKMTLRVGSIILAPGFKTFDPTLYETYHYGDYPNVLTSLEFERILSPTGPYLGELRRPSDQKEPKRIAWIQCVGSRDVNRCDHGYCSAVCCMYAVKQAIIAKEHGPGSPDITIFYMDMRTFGKDYEIYYNKAVEEYGIRFVRSRIHTIDPIEGGDDLLLQYCDGEGVIHRDLFDMVVLSVGLELPKETLELSRRLGITLDPNNFCSVHSFSPVETSVPGIYACGAYSGPKDIPSSVVEASAAACAAGIDLKEARGRDWKKREIPMERDVSQEEPRIGVFVCNCGTNIGGVVDVPAVVEYTSTLPGVVHVEENLFSCAQDTQDKMKEVIKEENLNRIVVAACSPKTHEPLFQETLQACGLNKYLFEMANIRNQDSWVHGGDSQSATDKAKDLVRMSVARASFLRPLESETIKVNQRGLVLGGGISGMTAALGLADQGFEVALIEKEAHLGGLARELTRTIEGAHIQDHLLELLDRVERHPKIQVLLESLVVGFNGFKGNFTTEIIVGPGMYERKIDHGVLIMATGAREYRPREFHYGEDPRVVTQIELGKRLDDRGADDLHRVVMIQCVGSRTDEYPNCSRVCCQTAVKNALHIKELNPEAEVIILYRDIRTYGILEDYYRESRERGVLFFRYSKENPPIVEPGEEEILVSFDDPILGRKVEVNADLLALSAGMRAEDTEELASILKLGRTRDGYLMEAHVKLRPVDMADEGIYVCGTAHSPKLISESISQAMAAASRAARFLSQGEVLLSAVTAKVDQEHCASCLICVRVCPYGVPRINRDGVSEIDAALCHGCGTCAAECPAKVIQLNWYEDDQLMSKLDALLEEVM